MDYREPQPRRFAPYQRKSLKKSKVSPHTTDDQQPWTQEEDEMLRTAVYKHGGKKWKTIATFLDKRTPAQCNARWNELQNHGTAVKRPWSPEEDMQMLELVQSHGAGKWAVIASYLPGRNGKQCRERWHNQLNPAIKKSPWTSEEDAIILEMQSKYGNCWAKITERLPGRTDNAVKNHWHSSMKGKLQHSSPSSSPPSSPSSSSCPSSATVASRTGLTRKRMSTKVTGGRSTRSRSNRRSAHIARGSSSPDCVAASACELDPTSAAYDDFANFALHDPVAPELFDLPRNVFEDVTDPLGFMRDHVLTSWTVPQLHDIADDKRDNMTQNAGECDSASSHFSEMPLSSQPADSLDTAAAESSCVISADAITALAPSPAFGDDATAAFAPSTAFDDDDMSGVSTSTEDTYSDAALSSFDKLCSSEGDSSCGYVKDELPLLESPECTPAPVDTDSLLPLPLTPPCTAAVGTGDEQFHGALFDWEQLPPELHPPELQTAQSSPFESIEIAMSVVEECFDALQALHADPLALYCGTGSDDAMSTQQCHAGPDASLGCMNEDIDALATHLCI